MNERMRRWLPALRIARRELVSHPLRTLLLVALVTLPVSAAVIASTLSATLGEHSENAVAARYGMADAQLEVTPWPRVTSMLSNRGEQFGWSRPRDLSPDDRRKRSQVRIDALLPPESRSTPLGRASVSLLGGGRVDALYADLDDPLTRGLARIAAGRAPETADEAAVSVELALELGLIDHGGAPRGDAVLRTLGGDLRVVGIVRSGQGSSSSVVIGPGRSTSYLVDLPDLETAELLALHRRLDDEGVASWMRDATVHPELWTDDAGGGSDLDPSAAAIAASIIGVGLVEVVVLVGAVFAVSARRQARALGLVAAAGGAPGDIRRIVLAQGFIIGSISSISGVSTGLALLAVLRGLWENLSDRLIESMIYPAAIIAAVALLGLASAILAAFLPAVGAGRRTAWEMLDENSGSSTARRPRRTFLGLGCVLVGVGAVGAPAGGAWIASEYGDRTKAPNILSLYATGTSLVLLLAGALVLLPRVVERGGHLVARGWLPWRLAAREAVRQRHRTTAAMAAISVIAAGAVFAGLATRTDSTVSAVSQRDAPDGGAVLSVVQSDIRSRRARSALAATITDVLGRSEIATLEHLQWRRTDVLTRAGDPVMIADRQMQSIADLPRSASRALAAGKLVINTYGHGDRSDVSRIVVTAQPRSGSAYQRKMVAVPVDFGFVTTAGAWISSTTAAYQGFTGQVDGELWVRSGKPITQDDLDRLAVYGLSGVVNELAFHATNELQWASVTGLLLLSSVIVALIVLISAAEGQREAATMTAIGASPNTQRHRAACHALLLGIGGSALGVSLGLAAGASLLQVTGLPGTSIGWLPIGAIAVTVPLVCGLVGWTVSPRPPSLVRRVD